MSPNYPLPEHPPLVARRIQWRALAAVAAWSATVVMAGAAESAAIDSPAPPEKLLLHVPSPDWRDQIIYFLLTDRFNDGDPRNNDQRAGEFDPADKAKYSGGDLRGVEQKIDYIKGLGATAIWLTPPVANLWWDPVSRYGGYHGYWAENFTAVDAHLGTLADYRQLSHRIHSAGMYLVQDIVLNHTGNFFSCAGNAAGDKTASCRPNPGPLASAAPSQWPFSQNDARDPLHRRQRIYHWTPDVTDYSRRDQELNFQMSGLDDLNTENPLVRRALRESYAHWIRAAGVDAYRVDTAFYVPPQLFHDFIHSSDTNAPGIDVVARATGRHQFHLFGEGFGIDKPFDDRQARKIERYMTAADGRQLLPGMLNFPLYGSTLEVFARGKPTAELGYRLRNMMTSHRRPHLMPTFVDNHDVDRYLAGGSMAGLKQSLLLIMTLPGIPVIYYGTEQAFTKPRAAMFRGGVQSGGNDHFDTTAPLYRFIRDAAALRSANRVFSRGTPTVLRDDPVGAGALAYRMRTGDTSALVIFNSADRETLLDNLATGLPAGSVLKGLFAIDAPATDLVVGSQGRISLALPARSGQVWMVSTEKRPVPAARNSISIDPPRMIANGNTLWLSGRAPGVDALRLVVDGDVAGATPVSPDATGRWQAGIATGAMIDPQQPHRVVAWAAAGDGGVGQISAARNFRIKRRWQLLADVHDPAGDDAGPAGRYRYPTDPTWGARRQMDIVRTRVYGAASSIRIELSMRNITRSWQPPNGFDHVAFTLFIEVPGQPGGLRMMPLQHAMLPQDMTWHYRLRAHGWSNALFAAAGAGVDHEGSPIAPAAALHADARRNTVTLTIPAAAIGSPVTLSGVRLYLATWDYDGGYRPLGLVPRSAAMGGGSAGDPLIMDDTGIITLP